MAGTQERAPPSVAAVAIGTAIVSGIMGYYLGQARSIGLFGSSPAPLPTSSNSSGHTFDDDDQTDDSLSDSDEAQDLGALKSFRGSTEECKLVLVVRTDLGMTKGSFSSMFSAFRLPFLPLHWRESHATITVAQTLISQAISPHSTGNLKLHHLPALLFASPRC